MLMQPKDWKSVSYQNMVFGQGDTQFVSMPPPKGVAGSSHTAWAENRLSEVRGRTTLMHINTTPGSLDTMVGTGFSQSVVWNFFELECISTAFGTGLRVKQHSSARLTVSMCLPASRGFILVAVYDNSLGYPADLPRELSFKVYVG